MNQLRDVLQSRVVNDPLTVAISDTVSAAVQAALSATSPRLAFLRSEVAEMLGVSPQTVTAMVRDGRLCTLGPEPQARVTIGSILALVGWPMSPAMPAAPLTAVPDLAADQPATVHPNRQASGR